MLETRIADSNATVWGSVGGAKLGKVGVTGTYTKTGKSQGIVGVQGSIGAGFTSGPNISAGVSNTFIIVDFKTVADGFFK